MENHHLGSLIQIEYLKIMETIEGKVIIIQLELEFHIRNI